MQPTNAPFLTRRAAEQWRRTQPSPAPAAPLAPPRPALAYRLALKVLPVLLVVLLLLVLALWFFLFGEERPERVRPELTPAQRARAFRLPPHS